MSAPTHSDSSNDQFDNVLNVINQLAQKSADGGYIYRGEPDHYEKVSSSLYRQCQEIGAKGFDIEAVQKEMLKEASRYTSQTDESEILAELQHYGGNTNLIDCTTDSLIALFFACNGVADEDGRVVLLKKSDDENKRIWQPKNPSNRVIAQKSVFVQPKKGFVEPGDAFASASPDHYPLSCLLLLLSFPPPPFVIPAVFSGNPRKDRGFWIPVLPGEDGGVGGSGGGPSPKGRGRRFTSGNSDYLRGMIVVSQSPVGWRRHATLNRLGFKLGQEVPTVARQYVHVVGHQQVHSCTGDAD